MNSHLLPVQILGTSFSLKTTDENPENLREVIAYFEKKIEETRQTVNLTDPLKLAILTGIILADELAKEKAKPSAEISPIQSQEIEQITSSLISRIDSVLI